MSKNQMALLQQLAEDRKESATRQLAQARQALQLSEKQLAILEQYRTDYRSRLGNQVLGGMAGDELRNYQKFMVQVSHAISQQQADVERRKQASVAAERAWREAHREIQSYRTLCERYSARERVEEERRLQRQSDEFASRAMQRANNPN